MGTGLPLEIEEQPVGNVEDRRSDKNKLEAGKSVKVV